MFHTSSLNFSEVQKPFLKNEITFFFIVICQIFLYYSAVVKRFHRLILVVALTCLGKLSILRNLSKIKVQ